MRLVFVEDGPGVGVAATLGNATIVALTAEALEAARASCVACIGIGELSSPAEIGAHERRLVTDVRALLEMIEPVGYDGALVDQDYNVVVAAQALASRAWVMRDAIRALEPREVAIVDEALDTWFADSGYDGSPWASLLRQLAAEVGADVRLLPPGQRTPSAHYATPHAGRRRARAAVRTAAALIGGRLPMSRRLLFVGPPLYDWARVARRNRTTWLGTRQREAGHDWTIELDGTVHETRGVSRLTAPVDDRGADLANEVIVALLGRSDLQLRLDGIDLLPALTPNLAAIARSTPAIAAAADAISGIALDRVAPDALCLPSITLLPQKRVVRAARARGIPVVAYQHGGAYSTHDWAPHDLADWGNADVFLTYGRGITPPAEPVIPVTAAFVPVGSARLAGWRRRAKPSHERTHVVWVAEAASRNWINYSLVEDTARYELECRGLERLGRGEAYISFRPYPGQEVSNGVVAWLRRSGLDGVRVASGCDLKRLLQSADVVVSDAASGTVWLEAIVLRKPFVLYVDPAAARLRTDVAADLAAACSLQTTRHNLEAALDRIAAGDLPQVDDAAIDHFLERYVLHHGRPLRDVMPVLRQLDGSTDQPSRGRK